VSFTILEDFPELTPSDLAAWNERLADYPEHPERNALRNAMRQAEHGPDVTEIDFARGDRDHWRITQNRDLGERSVIMDSAAAGAASWKLGGTAESVNLVVGILDGPAAAGQNVRASESGALQHLQKLLFAPIGLGTAEYVEVRSCARTGDTFRAEAVRVGEGQVVAVLFGRVSSAGQPIVLEATEYQADGKGVKRRIVARGHALDERLGLWVASETEVVERPSGVRRVYRYGGSSVVSDSQIKALTAIPSVKDGDAVRGAIASLTVYDTRPGRSEKVSYDDGQVVRAELPEDLRVAAGRQWLWVGWSLLGAGLLTVGWIRIRRS